MLFFTKKEKLCPICSQPMQKFPDFWKCDPCPELVKQGDIFCKETGITVSGILRFSHYEYKKHPIRDIIQRFKDAIYVFKNGMD